MVRMESNPSGSRPNFFGRQHLTFDKGRAWMPEVERPKALHGRKANRAFIWQEYSAERGIVRSGGCGGALLKHHCFTAEHHFNEC